MATAMKSATRIDIPAKTREVMITLLNQHLADISDLYSQTYQAHWNVRGAEFYQLHILFEKLGEELEEYIDMIAERVTTLGGVAKGTVRMAAAASRLPEYPSNVVGSLPTIKAMAVRYAAVAATTRAAIDSAEDEGDIGTTDLFTEVSRGLDKALWFLEAHLHEE
jgi:starvation-inducible DNA-binding protein